MCSGRQLWLSQHYLCVVVTVWLQFEFTFPILPLSSVGVDTNHYQLLYRKYDTLRMGRGGLQLYFFFFSLNTPMTKIYFARVVRHKEFRGSHFCWLQLLTPYWTRWQACRHYPRIASQVGKLSIGKRKGHHRIGFWHFQLPWHGSGLPGCGMVFVLSNL
jgi:hypothetical protein